MRVITGITTYLSNMKLREKIGFAVAVLSVVQVLVIGLAVYTFNARIIIEREREFLSQLIAVVNEDLTSRIEGFNSDALDIVINNTIKEQLNGATDLEVGIARRNIMEVLNSKSISRRGLLDISIIDTDANTYGIRAAYYLPPGFDIRATEVFRLAERLNGGMIWLNENDITDTYAQDSILLGPLRGLTGAAIIKDYSSDEIKGLLLMIIDEDYFEHIEYSNRRLENISLFLVPSCRDRIVSITPEAALAEEVLERIDPESDRGIFSIPASGDELLISYVRNKALGWYLVTSSPISSLRKTFKQTVHILLLSLALSMLLSFLLAGRISRWVTRGLDALAEKMLHVGRGNFTVPMNPNHFDEIGQLDRVFDGMVEDINRLIESRYQQELRAKEAGFKALQAQINPHFLHNTLDMLHWRLEEKGEQEISQSILSLGNLFRYTIDDSSIHASLSDEIGNVEDYLFLRNNTSRGSFGYSITVEPNEGPLLPKLTLQPLVENAIVHGFKGRKRGNVLTIRGRLNGKIYLLDVIDNGIGMTPEEISRIFDAEYKTQDAHHIGIRNVEERIRYMYGEKGGLTISSEFGFGTTIRISIPAEGIK